jgi:hypothetical protein
MKTRLLDMLPGVRWTPHDIPSHESTSKSKMRSRFSLRSSSLASSSALAYRRSVKKRRSTISLTSISDPELDARTLQQGQSMFFARLPIEIRRIVYEYVMGDEMVHLTLSTKQRFGHFVCEGSDEESKSEGCGCKVLVGGKQGTKLNGACTQLVRVCRRLYVLPSCPAYLTGIARRRSMPDWLTDTIDTRKQSRISTDRTPSPFYTSHISSTSPRVHPNSASTLYAHYGSVGPFARCRISVADRLTV